VNNVTVPGSHAEIGARVAEGRQEFSDAMQSDLNTAGALGAVWKLVRALNAAIDAGQIGAGDVPAIRDAFAGFDSILGVLALRQAEDDRPPVPIGEIERLVEERHAAKKRRDFAAADLIRKDLAERGVLLEDSHAGTRWKRK
jgi:cysteinyl-tRNA synthetase